MNNTIEIVAALIRDGAGRVEGEAAMPTTVVINPTVQPIGDELVLRWEGCLSIPGMRGAVPRFAKVRYAGVGLDGERVGTDAGGFHAGVVQHEHDHLDGILYPMRMTDHRLFGLNEELARASLPT